jgi:hypothetical protein
LVLRSLYGLRLSADPGGLHSAGGPENVTFLDPPLFAFRPSSESACTDAAIIEVALTNGCLPCGFAPLRRLPGTGQPLFLKGTNLQVRALSAFRTPSGPFSARDLPALFHAGPALGVFTLQGRSPPAEPFVLSDDVTLMRLAGLPGSVPTASAASGPGVPVAAVAVFRGDGASENLPLFRALLPASGRVSGAIV